MSPLRAIPEPPTGAKPLLLGSLLPPPPHADNMVMSEKIDVKWIRENMKSTFFGKKKIVSVHPFDIHPEMLGYRFT
jgi:hypothetical protein